MNVNEARSCASLDGMNHAENRGVCCVFYTFSTHFIRGGDPKNGLSPISRPMHANLASCSAQCACSTCTLIPYTYTHTHEIQSRTRGNFFRPHPHDPSHHSHQTSHGATSTDGATSADGAAACDGGQQQQHCSGARAAGQSARDYPWHDNLRARHRGADSVGSGSQALVQGQLPGEGKQQKVWGVV